MTDRAFCCLMPTYGRTAKLLNSALACFTRQTYGYKFLIIYDDLGNLARTKVDVPNVHIISTNKRASSVGAKYNLMLDYTWTHLHLKDPYIAVWDDDDLYLPNYLESHRRVLINQPWSKPDKIISTYTGSPVVEDAVGRFHGSIAANLYFLNNVNRWEDTRRGTFDQEFIAKLTSQYNPGVPDGPPQYVYRWGSTQARHSSGMIHEDDYFKYQPQNREFIPQLIPEFDTDEFETILLQQMLQER